MFLGFFFVRMCFLTVVNQIWQHWALSYSSGPGLFFLMNLNGFYIWRMKKRKMRRRKCPRLYYVNIHFSYQSFSLWICQNSKTQESQCMNINFLHLGDIKHSVKKKLQMYINKERGKNKKYIFSTLPVLTSEELREEKDHICWWDCKKTVSLGESICLLPWPATGGILLLKITKDKW